MTIPLYDVRDYTPNDKAFVISSFLKGNYYGHSWFSLIPQAIYFENYHKVAEHLVRTATIKIACLPEDPTIIIGYSILSSDFQTIHWVHVKKKFRGLGVAKDLLPKHPQYVSHLNDLGQSLMPKFPTAVFNPFKLT